MFFFQIIANQTQDSPYILLAINFHLSKHVTVTLYLWRVTIALSFIFNTFFFLTYWVTRPRKTTLFKTHLRPNLPSPTLVGKVLLIKPRIGKVNSSQTAYKWVKLKMLLFKSRVSKVNSSQTTYMWIKCNYYFFFRCLNYRILWVNSKLVCQI